MQLYFTKEEFLNMKFYIIGGDLRNFYLYKQLLLNKEQVKICGFNKLEPNINSIYDITEVMRSDIIILPIPFTKDNINLNIQYSDTCIKIDGLLEYLKNKVIVACNINTSLKEKLEKQNCKIIDIAKNEQFAVLNAIPTSEATIEIILNRRHKVLHNSNCLIMGYGRIGKVLSNKLKALNVNVTCLAMNMEEKSWCIASGYNIITVDDIKKQKEILKKYDIIINTIPKEIITEKLKEINKETLVIDLASKPGGINRKMVKELNINFVEALGLPRKICTRNISRIYKRDNRYRNNVKGEFKDDFRYYKNNHIWNSRRNNRMVTNK